MFIVEVGSVITSGIFLIDLARGDTGSLWFVGVITFWLWLTVLFANFAEAIAEGRGRRRRARSARRERRRPPTGAASTTRSRTCPPRSSPAATLPSSMRAR